MLGETITRRETVVTGPSAERIFARGSAHRSRGRSRSIDRSPSGHNGRASLASTGPAEAEDRTAHSLDTSDIRRAVRRLFPAQEAHRSSRYPTEPAQQMQPARDIAIHARDPSIAGSIGV